jgi:outer membrane protein OmpA-like peptidoglycan-associated protein
MQHISVQKIAPIFLVLMIGIMTGYTQSVKRPQPVWWFGESGAVNFNFYRGTTQEISEVKTTPTAFHNGRGIKPYASILAEYRPNRTWGGMLNLAYDNRGGKFESVIVPCNCRADLSTNLSYITVEPSLRIAPFSSAFYLFAGPVLSFNLTKTYKYTQEKQTVVRGDWSDIRETMLSAQAGAGVDIPISARTNNTQITLSPFTSFQTDLNRDPRSSGSWSVYTLRGGMAIKLGMVKKSVPVAIITVPAISPIEPKVQFSVRAPKAVPLNRKVKETFPLRNSVFFDQESTEIPGRYTLLSSTNAASFKEVQLQQLQPENLNNGRSSRQLALYYNILNIIGDRMRENPQSAIALIGVSAKNPTEGKILAENIKEYLVNVFGISASRISTQGRDKPVIPSEQSGITNDVALLYDDNRRVDIESNSPELLMQVGGKTSPFLKPVQVMAVQEDPLDSHVILYAEGAEFMDSWSVQITNEQGIIQYYGPYTDGQASIPGKTILGNSIQGNYKVLMIGKMKNGGTMKKETSVSLMKGADLKQIGLRYSILFDFDRSKSIAAYENFLTEVVTPLIPPNSTVIIHGHTDIIGEEQYNHKLSEDRATDALQIIKRAVLKTGIQGVKFETYGFGENSAAFENKFPEERFYNRTVIIDIVSDN